MRLHCFTGCDTTSSFKGIGKLKPLNAFQSNKHYESVLSQLGTNIEIGKALSGELESFVCNMYGFPKLQEINDVCVHSLKKKCIEKDKIDP